MWKQQQEEREEREYMKECYQAVLNHNIQGNEHYLSMNVHQLKREQKRLLEEWSELKEKEIEIYRAMNMLKVGEEQEQLLLQKKYRELDFVNSLIQIKTKY